MSQTKPRRLHFRGRNLTPDQLTVAQEYHWALKNCQRLMNEEFSDKGDTDLFYYLLDLSGHDLIEWNRRTQSF